MNIEYFRLRSEPDTNGGCWLWTGAQNARGYGRVQVGGATLLAHRVSFVLHKGPLNRHAQVCHKCDTPACVNPDHLYAGTAADNMRDAMERGQLVVPHIGHIPALAPDRAAQIVAELRDGETQRAICRKYGIGKGTVHRVAKGLGAYAVEGC